MPSTPLKSVGLHPTTRNLAAFLLLLLPFPAFAQATPPPTPKAPTRRVPARPTMDDRIAVLSKNLELTEPQRDALKKILLQRQQESLRIRNSNVPGDVRIGQFRLLQDQTVEKIRSILTEDQKKKYDPMLARQRPAQESGQRSLEDWIKLTTPH